MSAVQSHLARHVGREPLSDAELRAMAARAYHDHGILLVRVEAIGNAMFRRAAETIAEHLYGKRETKP